MVDDQINSGVADRSVWKTEKQTFLYPSSAFHGCRSAPCDREYIWRISPIYLPAVLNVNLWWRRSLRHLRNAASTLGALSASIALGLVVVEGVAHIFPSRFFDYGSDPVGDALLGIPLSFPDTEHYFTEAVKPSNVFRVVVLGDSQTVSVPYDLSYPKLLEDYLKNQDLGGKKLEVYDAGAQGHSPYQYYLTLNDRLLKFKPDLIIVALYVGNDFLDLYREDDRPSLAFDGTNFNHRPPVFSKYRAPVPEPWWVSFRITRLTHGLWTRSAGYQISRVRAIWAVGQNSGEGILASAKYLYTIARGNSISDAIFRQSMNQILFLKTFPKEKIVIDRINLYVLDMMVSLSRREGFQLLYMPVPSKLQIEPETTEPVLQKTLDLCGFDRSALALEDSLTEGLFKDLSERAIKTIELAQMMRERRSGGELYDSSFHLAPEGHKVIASLLGPIVAKAVIVPASASSPTTAH